MCVCVGVSVYTCEREVTRDDMGRIDVDRLYGTEVSSGDNDLLHSSTTYPIEPFLFMLWTTGLPSGVTMFVWKLVHCWK